MPQRALELHLELGQREVRGRRDQPSELGLMRLGQQPAAEARRRGTPVARTRCISFIAADGLTAKRRAAASRIELPRSTAPTMHSRRSNDNRSRHEPHLNHNCRITDRIHATGFVQAHEGVRQLLLGGPEVGAAIDVMIKRASAHPRDAQAFQAVIRRYLQGEGGLASPVALATLGAPDAPSSACPT